MHEKAGVFHTNIITSSEKCLCNPGGKTSWKWKSFEWYAGKHVWNIYQKKKKKKKTFEMIFKYFSHFYAQILSET